LTAREICAEINPALRQRGLLFVGIVIDGFLTEIVTSPTGIRAIKNLGGTDVAAMIWDRIEMKRAKAREGTVWCARFFALVVFNVTILCVAAFSPAAAEQQSVAGIAIDYPVLFERMQPGAEEAKQRLSTVTWGVWAGAIEVHQAAIPPTKRLTGASGMLEIARVKFAPERSLNLDDAARRTMATMVQEPVKVVNQDISAARISGLDGRRVSFEAKAGAWTVFGQALLIQNPDRNDFWEIKIILLRRLLATFFVSSDRIYPNGVLDTVRVIDNPNPTP